MKETIKFRSDKPSTKLLKDLRKELLSATGAEALFLEIKAVNIGTILAREKNSESEAANENIKLENISFLSLFSSDPKNLRIMLSIVLFQNQIILQSITFKKFSF